MLQETETQGEASCRSQVGAGYRALKYFSETSKYFSHWFYFQVEKLRGELEARERELEAARREVSSLLCRVYCVLHCTVLYCTVLYCTG